MYKKDYTHMFSFSYTFNILFYCLTNSIVASIRDKKSDEKIKCMKVDLYDNLCSD